MMLRLVSWVVVLWTCEWPVGVEDKSRLGRIGGSIEVGVRPRGDDGSGRECFGEKTVDGLGDRPVFAEDISCWLSVNTQET